MNPGLSFVVSGNQPAPMVWPGSPSDTETALSDSYEKLEPFFDIHRRSNIKEDHNDYCERALTQATAFPQLPVFDGLPCFPIADMHDRATGILDGTFLFLIRFEEHKDSAEVVGLLKQYLARHRWAFKQNTAFKKLSNKKVERATFQVLGPLSRREETKDDHRLSIYITKHSDFGDKWLFEFRRSSRNVNSIPTEILPERVSATVRGCSTPLPAFPSSIITGPAKYDYMEFARRSIESLSQDSHVSRLSSSVAEFWGSAHLSTLEIIAPTFATAKKAEAALNSFLLLGGPGAQCDEPARKYRKLDHNIRCSALTCGIWWDLVSGRSNVTTLDGFVTAALEEASISTVDMNMQMQISTLCGVINQGKCPISLIVFTGAELLDSDLCTLGRWRCLHRALNSSNCSTKIVLITQRELSNYTDPQGVCRVSLADISADANEDICNWDFQSVGLFDDVAMSDETTSATASDNMSTFVSESYSSVDSTFGVPYYDEDLRYDPNMRGSNEMAAPLFTPDLQLEEVMHPSLNGIYESFMASRKRKFPF